MAEELSTLAGEVLAEETMRKTVAGLVTAEKEKQETVAGKIIAEKRTENTLASKTTAEKPTADTVAGIATAEKENIRSTIAGKVTSEKVMESTIAGKSIIEADVKKPIAGLATAEERTQRTLAAKSTLENAVGGTNKTVAGISDAQKLEYRLPLCATLADKVVKDVEKIMREAVMYKSNNATLKYKGVRALIAGINPDATTSGVTYAPNVVVAIINYIYSL